MKSFLWPFDKSVDSESVPPIRACTNASTNVEQFIK